MREYYFRLLRPFEEKDDHPGYDKYLDGLKKLYETGNLVPFFGSLPADHQSLARDIWERLSNLNHAIKVNKETVIDSTAIGNRLAINRSIGEVVENIRENLKIARREVANREREQKQQSIPASD